jgi:hypothetical protein
MLFPGVVNFFVIHFLSKLFCGICGIYVIQLNFYEFLIVFRFFYGWFSAICIYLKTVRVKFQNIVWFFVVVETRERDRLLGIEFFL